LGRVAEECEECVAEGEDGGGLADGVDEDDEAVEVVVGEAAGFAGGAEGGDEGGLANLDGLDQEGEIVARCEGGGFGLAWLGAELGGDDEEVGELVDARGIGGFDAEEVQNDAEGERLSELADGVEGVAGGLVEEMLGEAADGGAKRVDGGRGEGGSGGAAEVGVGGTIGGGDDAVVGERGLRRHLLDEFTGTATGDACVGGEGVVVAEDRGGVGVGGDDPGLLELAPVNGVVCAELTEDAVWVGPGFIDGGVEGGTGCGRGGRVRIGRCGVVDERQDVACLLLSRSSQRSRQDAGGRVVGDE